MSLHTAGELLNWHPHLHCLILTGTVDKYGKFHCIEEIDNELLQEFFAQNVFRLLLDKELISEDIISNMNSWNHSGFSIWMGDDIKTQE